MPGGVVNVPAGWTEFTHANGRYKTAFPGKPQEQTVNAGGLKFIINVIENKNQGSAFVVAYNDMPNDINLSDENLANKALDGGVAGMAKGGKAATTKITYGKYLGREVLIDAVGGKKQKARMYLVGNRLYQVLVEWDSRKGDLSSDADTFLNLFRLTDAGAGGPGVQPPGGGLQPGGLPPGGLPTNPGGGPGPLPLPGPGGVPNPGGGASPPLLPRP